MSGGRGSEMRVSGKRGAEALGIKDWLNRSEIVEKVGLLRDLARQICAALLVSHNRKSDGESGDEIAGSNAFTGAVDGWISAYKAESLPNGNRRLFLRTETEGCFCERKGAAAFAGNSRWRGTRRRCISRACRRRKRRRGRRRRQATNGRRRLPERLEDYRGKATVKQISELVEWPYSTVARRVKSLVASGFLVDMGERLAECGKGPASAVYALA